MIVLLGIGFVAGLVTAISPCVLPMLPIILASGAASGESRRRPLAIILGLVVSFVVFTLAGSAILSRLGLPQDLLRNIAIALLFLVAATLLVPRLAELVARPLYRLSRRGPVRRQGNGKGNGKGSGLLLGVSLGLVCVPCAGPVLAAVTVTAATGTVGVRTVLLAISYALGVALPLLAIAYGGRRLARGVAALKRNALTVRRASGVVLAGMAVAFLLGVDTDLAKLSPGYTQALQQRIEQSSTAERELRKLTRSGAAPEASTKVVPDFRHPTAPEFRRIDRWLNTPDGRPLTMAGLRGKVVLIDFWTYSCINCLRTLPHLKAWDAAYREAGLVIVGVHSPEFAFERVPSNVQDAVRKLGIRYPVALDNAFGTWRAYNNEYWPAKYLIGRDGQLRKYHAGEGRYAETETAIRLALAQRRGAAVPGPTAPLPDTSPTNVATPESYLGHERLALDRYGGSLPIRQGVQATYQLPPTLPLSHLAYGGSWRVDAQRIVAGPGARLRLAFLAKYVYLVLGGEGRVEVLVDGRRTLVEPVSGFARLHTLVSLRSLRQGLLELRFTPGVEAYAFTFG